MLRINDNLKSSKTYVVNECALCTFREQCISNGEELYGKDCKFFKADLNILAKFIREEKEDEIDRKDTIKIDVPTYMTDKILIK